MSSRKEIQNSISRLETKIQMEKARLSEHRHYFDRLLNNKYLLIASLVPVFLAGWHEARIVKPGKSKFKRFVRFILMTTLAHVRNSNLLKSK
ncbi:Uncharacterised protein [Legionella lansingensis]|uniref:Uncharacterized protein n=1 Tax=Legionella lansingensis TaxID=45067 RepID=A0A0W0VIK4_9GAMM|nr:hypothetical protein Llan_2047 [Legionella lansingensis]SNV48554.1 Uncharacterised protein [Legionella lansingensis]